MAEQTRKIEDIDTMELFAILGQKARLVNKLNAELKIINTVLDERESKPQEVAAP
jgi:hypothetical protein